MTIPVWDRARAARDAEDSGRPLYERVAGTISDAIRSGEIPQGYRLPTVRHLARDLEISGSTVVSVYSLLRDEGLVRGEIGRGTFVHLASAMGMASSDAPRPMSRRAAPPLAWRRPMLAAAEARLRLKYPDSVDLMRGSPDPAFLPVAGLRRALTAVARKLTADDLQYPRQNEADASLIEQVIPRLHADGIPAEPDDVIAASSAQQLLAMMAQIVLLQGSDDGQISVAIEEPGYQTAMDTFERLGILLVGLACDEFGVVPSSLRSALSSGTRLAILTPRAQSPMGISWNQDRVSDLAAVFADFPSALAIEDDHFAETSSSRPGSLFAHPELGHRVLYIRSFAKSLAPDMRLSVGAARGSLRHSLSLAKSYADGWTSRAIQRAMALLLADPETDELLARATAAYAERRAAALGAFSSAAPPGSTVQSGPDGLHVWLPVPPGCDINVVLEKVAGLGYLAAPSEPFYILPGNTSHIRLNAGGASPNESAAAAAAIAHAISEVSETWTVALTP